MLVDSPLGAWTQGLAETGDADSGPCGDAATMMDEQLFEDAMVLPDEVLGELLLHADAAMRAREQACATGDEEQAALEDRDLGRTAELGRGRLDEIGIEY
ncbi:MAG: hypothetical protein ACK5PP_02320 [Acidimicrobiales bacterium]